MFSKIISVLSLISIVILIILLNTTTPSGVGPTGILFIFLSFYMGILSAIAFLIYAVISLLVYFSKAIHMRKPLIKPMFNHCIYYSTIISAAVVIFVGMKSVGVTNLYTTILILIFAGLGCFYINKRLA